ncbi:hypothetical protein LINGRAHAP2_LOCUS31005, partial [Linum grandiflorum]
LSEDEIDSEIALLSSKLKRLIKYKRNVKRSNSDYNDHSSKSQDRHSSRNRTSILSKLQQDTKKPKDDGEKETRKCFKCGKTGYLRPDCPMKKENRERGLDVTLSDSDTDSDSDNQISAYMALTYGENSDNESQETNKNEWFLDSGCSHYMTGNVTLFSKIKYKLGGKVTFGGTGKGRVIGTGIIGTPHNPVFHNVMLVDGLCHNLLSISQLCAKDN